MPLNIPSWKDFPQDGPLKRELWQGQSCCCCCSCCCWTAIHGDLLWPEWAWHPKKNNPRLKVKALHRHPLCNPFLFLRSAIFGRLLHHVSPPRQPLKRHDTLPQTNTHELCEHYSITAIFLAFRMLSSTRRDSHSSHTESQRIHFAPRKYHSPKSISSAQFSNCAAEQQRDTLSKTTPKYRSKHARSRSMKLRGKLSGSDKRGRGVRKNHLRSTFSWNTAHVGLLGASTNLCTHTNTLTHTHTHTHHPLLTFLWWHEWFTSLEVLGGREGLASLYVSACVWLCSCMCIRPFMCLCVSVLHLGRVKELSGQITSLPLLGFLCLSVSAQMKICSTQITRVPSHRFLGNPSCLKPLVAVLFIVRECARVCVCRWMFVFVGFFFFFCNYRGCHFCAKAAICCWVDIFERVEVHVAACCMKCL